MSIPSLRTDPADALFLNDDCVSGTKLPNFIRSTFLSQRKMQMAVITAWTLLSVRLALPLHLLSLFVESVGSIPGPPLPGRAPPKQAEETPLSTERTTPPHDVCCYTATSPRRLPYRRSLYGQRSYFSHPSLPVAHDPPSTAVTSPHPLRVHCPTNLPMQQPQQRREFRKPIADFPAALHCLQQKRMPGFAKRDGLELFKFLDAGVLNAVEEQWKGGSELGGDQAISLLICREDQDTNSDTFS
ncbi:hypothetical protein DFH06DRAFT_1126069 [Mycena polygramma]|nr:hypothetical protein DFH06DRAFT_1126069 [Mycena polygramma]